MTHREFIKALPQLAKDYKAAPDVLKHIGNLTLLMVVGPSGVGKTTLIEQSGYAFIPTDTTREPRPGEQNGIDMYFRKNYDQVTRDIKTGRFVQTAVFANGELYATKDTSYPPSGVAAMPVMADVITIFRNLGFEKTITAFVAPPSYEEWMRRLKTHPVTEDQLKKRLEEARRSLTFALHDDEAHFILNDDIDSATRQVKDLVNGMVNASREEKARKAAEEMIKGIN